MASADRPVVPDLVDRARAGDAAAFHGIVVQYAARLRHMARGAVPARARARLDVDDLVQEMLWAIWRGLPGTRFASRGAFEGWLIRVGRHRLVDLVRRDLCHRRGAGAATSWESSRVAELASGATSPSHAARAAERQEGLRSILERLPPAYGEVLYEVRVRGRTTAEVAAALKVSPAAVRKRLERGLAMCREVVQGTSFDRLRSG